MPTVANTDAQISGDTLLTAEDNATVSGALTFSTAPIFQDSVAVAFGTGSDATVQYDGTNMLIDPQAVGSGHLVLSAGRLGIGETSPLAPLHITVDQASLTELRIDNSNASGSMGLKLFDGSNERSKVVYDTAAALLTVGTNIATGQFAVETGSGVEALRIDSGGDVDAKTGFKIAGGAVVVTSILDEDAMGSDSATALATQQSIKAYVDSQGAKPFLSFTPQANQPPSSNAATQDTRNGHPVLDFDDTTQETAIFGGVLSPDYNSGGLTVEVYWMATSATSGSVVWEASIERHQADTTDLDSDSFAAANTVQTTTASAAGEHVVSTITFTDGADMDSLAAGESFRLKIERDADGTNGTDDMTGDAELLRAVVRES